MAAVLRHQKDSSAGTDAGKLKKSKDINVREMRNVITEVPASPRRLRGGIKRRNRKLRESISRKIDIGDTEMFKSCRGIRVMSMGKRARSQIRSHGMLSGQISGLSKHDISPRSRLDLRHIFVSRGGLARTGFGVAGSISRSPPAMNRGERAGVEDYLDQAYGRIQTCDGRGALRSWRVRGIVARYRRDRAVPDLFGQSQCTPALL